MNKQTAYELGIEIDCMIQSLTSAQYPIDPRDVKDVRREIEQLRHEHAILLREERQVRHTPKRYA